jgi:hypothetical protein
MSRYASTKPRYFDNARPTAPAAAPSFRGPNIISQKRVRHELSGIFSDITLTHIGGLYKR